MVSTLLWRYFPDARPPITQTTQAFEQQLSVPAYRAMQAVLVAAEKNRMEHNQIVTLIDYSLPANQKRLWVFDLSTQQVLFHTYVSHGINSGALHTTRFSNRYNSKSSSMGVYRTQKTYRGREGLTLKLQGLDPGFNDNAENRAIVMHGGWYMDEAFIHKYGRSGRSWGCPALPLTVSSDLINTIKDNALLIIYYPDKKWFSHSKFLQDDAFFAEQAASIDDPTGLVEEEPERGAVLLANLNPLLSHKMDEAILALPAEAYQHQFAQAPPLSRMLRRQIHQKEYIAISPEELTRLNGQWADLCFVVPTLRMERGYYLTEMKIIDLGAIQSIDQQQGTVVHLANNRAVVLRTSQQFIRWLGL